MEGIKRRFINKYMCVPAQVINSNPLMDLEKDDKDRKIKKKNSKNKEKHSNNKQNNGWKKYLESRISIIRTPYKF